MTGKDAPRGCADRGRTAVGAAELAAFGGTDLDDERSIEELARRAAGVVAGPWWRAAGGSAVVVLAARTDAKTSSARRSRGARSGAVEIRLARGQRDLATLAHELGHALAGIEHGHDERFRAAEVDVVAVLAGEAHGHALAACFGSFSLVVAPRPWPVPSGAVGDRFVLRG